ncbi:four helix bundle protein [Lacihabitans soyangensis]|uniref:Four helix bundle protein n=1 Tax=Lacihabitans soyangensis TaxID=869394 RepID=A0AAE3H6P3_9BACT|nr:four helix bundle protein [Lacihabitans soyangensis]MCP9763995.1 four helix bundle protein [Lacihabitans soyangensis]
MIKNFTDLEVYKECRQLRINISILVKTKFPLDEKYKLADQILRSSRSITANIAEGFSRYYYKENIQFCRISRGSLNETLEHLITAFDEKYINDEELMNLKTKIDLGGKLLNGYINHLKKTQKPKEED